MDFELLSWRFQFIGLCFIFDSTLMNFDQFYQFLFLTSRIRLPLSLTDTATCPVALALAASPSSWMHLAIESYPQPTPATSAGKLRLTCGSLFQYSWLWWTRVQMREASSRLDRSIDPISSPSSIVVFDHPSSIPWGSPDLKSSLSPWEVSALLLAFGGKRTGAGRIEVRSFSC